jgi:hypothetical protein
MSKKITIQTISILAIMTIIAGVSIMPKAIAQPSPTSNATAGANDAFEKLFQKAPSNMAGGVAGKYSAWLIVCGPPPITNAEEQCDTPTRLH